MSLSIANSLPNAGANVYYSQAWQLMIETHLPWILARSDNRVLSVDPATAAKYEGDLYGLLTARSIARQYHWVIMRLNNLRTPADYHLELRNLIVPNDVVIEQLTERHRTTMRKIK